MMTPSRVGLAGRRRYVNTWPRFHVVTVTSPISPDISGTTVGTVLKLSPYKLAPYQYVPQVPRYRRYRLFYLQSVSYTHLTLPTKA